MKILEFINSKTNNAYKDFKLVSVIFDRKERECTFKFLYKDECKDDDRDFLGKLIKEYLDEEVKVTVKLKKAYVDDDLVKTVLANYIARHNASLSDTFKKDDIRVEISDVIAITIMCNAFTYNYLNGQDVRSDILDYVQGFFFEPVMINLEKINILKTEIHEEDLIPAEAFIIEEEVASKKIRYNKIKKIGSKEIKGINGNPLTINSVDTSMENVEIVGELLFLNERSFESKRKDKDGNTVTKIYYSFTLKDETGKMSCVYFPTKDMLESVKDILVEHKTIIVNGQAEEFNGRVNFKAKYIGECELLPLENEEEPAIETIKEPNENYLFVKPEPYVEVAQDNLFAIKDTIGQYLYDNDVVVFDIETTGLDALTCEIIEIGAVKIKGGRITETFETLIKPTAHIPDEIVNLTGINDEMVKDSLSIKQVLPDFYKFCYGTTIMAYNIDFDYKFINIAGMKLGYNFDMRQIDALYLARAFIPGLKNFKLGTVCKKLGVSLENAHRAVHDATATAEVVIKLSPNIT